MGPNSYLRTQCSEPILCASRNPTSPSRTTSCTKVAQDGAKLAPTWVQKSTHNGGITSDFGAKGPTFRKKSVQKSNATKNRVAFLRVTLFWPKNWPTWPQVGLQNRSKIDQKSMQKSIVFLMPLGVDLWTNFVNFCFQNEAKLGPKWDQKSM